MSEEHKVPSRPSLPEAGSNSISTSASRSRNGTRYSILSIAPPCVSELRALNADPADPVRVLALESNTYSALIYVTGLGPWPSLPGLMSCVGIALVCSWRECCGRCLCVANGSVGCE